MANPNPLPPPKDKQFGQPGGNQQGRGFWKKEDTPRFKLERMMELSEADIKKIMADKDAPKFERKIAECLNSGDWRTIEAMVNQVYGYPKQSIEQVNLPPPKVLDDLRIK